MIQTFNSQKQKVLKIRNSTNSMNAKLRSSKMTPSKAAIKQWNRDLVFQIDLQALLWIFHYFNPHEPVAQKIADQRWLIANAAPVFYKMMWYKVG